jgi:iron complex outermembrane receptor protein
MNYFKPLFIFCSVLFSFLYSHAETGGPVKGKVSTSDGKAAEGVTVSVKGTKKAAVTDAGGQFVLRNLPAGTHTLQVSLVGYEVVNQVITVGTTETPLVAIQLTVSELQLEEVTVTNGQNKFAKKESDNIARLPLKNLENPQFYSVITKELVAEQMAVDYRSALKNIPGSNVAEAPNGAIFTRMRGFYTGSYVRNGLAAQQYVGMDPINIERVEALRGPSGTLFGSSLITFGGLTNRVTKKPFDHFKGEINYSAGSWSLNRLTADINAPLNKDKSVLMRVNAAVGGTNTFQDYGFNRSSAFAPSLLFKVNEKLSVLLDVELFKSNRIAAAYPSLTRVTVKNFKDLSLDYKTSLNTNDEMIRQHSTNVFAQATYKFNDQWTSQTLFAASEGVWDAYNSITANWISDTSIRRTMSRQIPRNMVSKNFQQNFTGDFHIGQFRNRFLAGIDVYYYTVKTQSYTGIDYDTVFTNLPVTKPIRPISMTRVEAQYASILPSATASSQLQYAAYVSDVFNITEQLNAMVSLRVDRFENRGSSANGGAPTGVYSQTAFSPKFGLVYEVIKGQLSVFGNYMNGFSNLAPTSPMPDNSIVILKPQQANQWEGGVKMELAHKVTASVSYYNIDVSNMTRTEVRKYLNASNVEVDGNFTVQDGTQRSRGLDAEVIANPVAGLNMLLGYGYNDIRYIKSADNVKGMRGTMAPYHQGNCWISYKFQGEAVKGLGIGVGGNYVGKSYWDNINTFIAPAYTMVDATVFYEKPTWRFGLKVNNLGDQKGWGINGEALSLRQFIGSVGFRF